ncbi:MAG: hypothetical protein ACXWV0_10600 [Flavisolibacter sp.]
MKYQPIIQKLIACCLVLVFVAGSAPRSFFHDVFADHEDVPACTIDHDTDVLHAIQVHCEFDDHVVPASFIIQQELRLVAPVVFLVPVKPAFHQSFLTSFMQFRESRGPPSA